MSDFNPADSKWDKFRDANGFIDVGKMAASYSAAEAHITKLSQHGKRDASGAVTAPAPPSGQPQARPGGEAPGPPGAPQSVPQGIQQQTIDELMGIGQQDWDRNGGKFSEEFVRAAEAKGVPRAMAQQYADGLVAQQKAALAVALQEVYTAAGSKENFDTWHSWMKVNLPADQQAQVVGAINGPTTRAAGVQMLKQHYEQANGKPGNPIVPYGTGSDVGANAGTNPFRSLKELTEAMADSRYDVTNGRKYDPDYRREVEPRLAASVRAGIDLGIRVVNNGTRIL
jgi:hypothetical protein